MLTCIWNMLDMTPERAQDCDGTKVAELRIFGFDGKLWKSLEMYQTRSGERKVRGPPIVL